MTKVDLHFDLVRALGDEDLDAVARVHGVYGIQRVILDPSLQALTVEFDATRMSEQDVQGALLRVGIPLVRR